LKTMVESIAETYEDPESVVNYYYSNKELLSGAEAAVLEDQVVDVLAAAAAIKDESTTYQDLVKPEASGE